MKEISARLREELDYDLEARHTQLYGNIFADDRQIRVPDVVPELSTTRLLAMTWLEGRKLLDYKTAPLEDRNAIARAHAQRGARAKRGRRSARARAPSPRRLRADWRSRIRRSGR